MRLRHARIFGFKTFADRVEFTLAGGVTAVVGPNGCGKSNLVDAILWGLGEGNARQLRAAVGQDVIFNGSSKRRAVGFAEVSLHFDNEDGALPISASEVVLSRKLNRAGDSEYRINGQHCRLRDVHELLADSGLGRAGYAIVGQKEIDSALAASAEDRRAWIDEAAGVQRYRARKVESLRRLASAKESLARVEDILRELREQRDPLAQEAEVARLYRSRQQSFRAVELGLLISEVLDGGREVERITQQISEITTHLREQSLRAEEEEGEAARTSSGASALDARLDAERASLQSHLLAAERAESAIQLARQRLEALVELGESLAKSESDLAMRIEEAARDVGLAVANRETATTARDAARQGIDREIATDNELRIALETAESVLREARQEEAKRQRAEALRQQKGERARGVERELEGIEASLPDLLGAISERRAVREAVVDQIASQLGVRSVALKQMESLRAEDQHRATVLRGFLADQAALEGRRRGLEASLDSLDGVPQGTRSVLGAVAQGELPDRFLKVADVLSVEKKLAVAIETALGNSSGDLVVEDDRDAQAAIRYLKENRAGRTTFQPLNLLKETRIPAELASLETRPGILGRASQLIQFAPAYARLAESLLGRILVAESLEIALANASTTGWNRIVTLSGEVVFQSGAVAGGVSQKGGYGLVQRRADIQDIDAQLRRLAKEVDRSEAERSRLDSATAALAREISEVDQRLTVLRREEAESDSFFRALEQELKAAEREREKLQTERARLTPEPTDETPAPDLAEAEQARDTAAAHFALHRERSEVVRESLARHDAEVKAAEEFLASAHRRLRAAEEAEAGRGKRLENLAPERLIQERLISARQGEVAEAKRSEVAAQERLANLSQHRRDLLAKAEAHSESARAARANATCLADASHQAEIARARADSRRSASLARLIEEYGLTAEDAVEQEGAHPIPPDAAQLVPRLRRELKAMGDVNLGAIDAFDRLDVRLRELEAQHDDVTQGMQQILQSIRELDHLTRDRFTETLAQVQEAFRGQFQALFGGGEGEVRLTDADNLLESGIEIDVTLPGKRRQALALLSGGERSLCATAFLFALLEVRPAPLVVLDEVDAPLDGRNVERFSDALHRLTDRTQFIVITHNSTTIEAADTLLGVSMQEPGVSVLIPARLPAK